MVAVRRLSQCRTCIGLVMTTTSSDLGIYFQNQVPFSMYTAYSFSDSILAYEGNTFITKSLLPCTHHTAFRVVYLHMFHSHPAAGSQYFIWLPRWMHQNLTSHKNPQQSHDPAKLRFVKVALTRLYLSCISPSLFVSPSPRPISSLPF